MILSVGKECYRAVTSAYTPTILSSTHSQTEGYLHSYYRGAASALLVYDFAKHATYRLQSEEGDTNLSLVQVQFPRASCHHSMLYLGEYPRSIMFAPSATGAQASAVS
jgi:hypothetical protein